MVSDCHVVWGHRDGLQEQRRLHLSFAPRTLMYIAGRQSGGCRFICGSVGNCRYGSRLRPEEKHDVYGHNIRGLGFNHKHGKLLVACQTLDPATFTTYERVFWGVLMQNGLSSIPLDQLLSVSGDAGDTAAEEAEYSGTSYASQQRYPLGTPSIGSGDPGTMVVTKNDTTLIVISGVNQVAFRTASHMPFERLKTGKRPEAICLDRSREGRSLRIALTIQFRSFLWRVRPRWSKRRFRWVRFENSHWQSRGSKHSTTRPFR